MRVKNIYLCLSFGLLFCTHAYAQSRRTSFDDDQTASGEDKRWQDKIYVGGGLGGISFSTLRTIINANGMAGYRLTKKLNAGLGLSYQYARFNPTKQDFHDYGLDFFTQYQVYPPFFLMARYEILFLDLGTRRKTYDAFFLGAGISQPISEKVFFNLFALYNFSFKPGGDNGRYASPWVFGARIGLGL